MKQYKNISVNEQVRGLWMKAEIFTTLSSIPFNFSISFRSSKFSALLQWSKSYPSNFQNIALNSLLN